MNYYYDSQIVAKIDVSDKDCWFEIFAVFLIDGKKYWASSAGCSCPDPFEDFTSVDQLNALNSEHDFESLESEVKSRAGKWGAGNGTDYQNVSLADINNFMVSSRS